MLGSVAFQLLPDDGEVFCSAAGEAGTDLSVVHEEESVCFGIVPDLQRCDGVVVEDEDPSAGIMSFWVGAMKGQQVRHGDLQFASPPQVWGAEAGHDSNIEFFCEALELFADVFPLFSVVVGSLHPGDAQTEEDDLTFSEQIMEVSCLHSCLTNS